MLVELAVGDAYGAGFEYADPEFVTARNNLDGYVQHPTHLGIRPGCYTDDTQMTIAVVEQVISGEAWTAERLAERFVTAFQRDRREGYAGGFYRLLSAVQDGAELLSRIEPRSEKSGAAMRAGPVGLVPFLPDVVEIAAIQARVTHDTPAGIEAAQAAALAVHYCHYELGPLAEIARWIDAQLPGGWSEPWRGQVGAYGWMSVRAALTALTSSRSLREILRACVAFTGDVDTVATVALGAASRSPQVVNDLPSVLRRDLEDGPYGRGYLWQLDARLLSRVSPLVGPGGPSVVGLWGDDSLFQGTMEGDRVAFLADGNGWFEHANAFAVEVERFHWEQLPAGELRISFTRYLFLESNKPVEANDHWHAEPRVLTARVGRGTDALDREATVLTLEESGEQPRRFALIDPETTTAADPTSTFS